MKKYIPLVLSMLLCFRITPSIAQATFQHPPPVPYFIITGLCYGDTTHFINKTASLVIRSEWNITTDKGDTIYRSKDKDASYYFKKRGVYNICLSADNGHIASKIRTVRIDTITKAAFAFRNCYNEFENLSTCSDQFVWVLPDNSTSTDMAPAYTFTAPGTYPVKLTVSKGNKTNQLFKMVHLTGDSVGVPDATFTCRRIDTSSTFEFKALDSLADSYSWYFGDNIGDDTSGYKVIHHIDKSVYMPPVNLFIANACGFSVEVLDPFMVTAVAEEKKIKLTMELYPNPVSDELTLLITHVTAGKLITLRLMDANGCVLKETILQRTAEAATFNYDTDQLSPGIYLVQVIAGEQVLNKKFIIH